MNPSRTLADRFRTQRTERIRVDGSEILSVLELELPAGSLFEILVDDQRAGTEQGICLTADTAVRVVETVPPLPEATTAAAEDVQLVFDGIDEVVLQLEPSDEESDDDMCRVRLWNIWMLDGSAQAWTGNAGMVLEGDEAPEGADRRFRLWCSDGLGNASFDDLTLVVTIAAQLPE